MPNPSHLHHKYSPWTAGNQAAQPIAGRCDAERLPAHPLPSQGEDKTLSATAPDPATPGVAKPPPASPIPLAQHRRRGTGMGGCPCCRLQGIHFECFGGRWK